ncbi:LolA family protein [Streptomyces orinoci]|uniref:Outer-membrane lipoprotein carrier protein LolA n=1 Tax=Streptomyces orinoci TaxID=67339 RepID=A0ABV3K7L7_STRON|nr:outer-membrane lipoprotein carrier protein LolA [Streptomyces orinoci]
MSARIHPGRRTVRYAVPVAVAGVAAATIGIGTAIATSGDPDLPKISAQDLIAKVAGSDVQRMSGSVRVTSDLGLPSLPAGMSFGAAGKGAHGGASAAPDAKLTELVSGTHTLRLAADGPDRQRVSIVEPAAEYSLIHNGDQVWAYDSGSNTAYHSTQARHQDPGHTPATATPQELAKKALAAVDDTTSVTVDGTAKVAGRNAYRLTIKPKQSGTTVDAVRIAVDAKNGVPLRFTVTPKGGGKAAVDAVFTKISFSRPSASSFDFTPPKGTKVTEGKAGQQHHGTATPRGGDSKVIGKGWTSVVELKGPDKGIRPQSGKDSSRANALLNSFGSKVNGSFGSGRILSTRLVNVLLTEDGRVYAGAVDKDALVKAADSGK